MPARLEYLIDEAGWDVASTLAAVRQALEVVKPSVVRAETDIPWHKRDQWPPEVTDAALLLRDRYARDARHEDYQQTGVQLVDEDARDAFTIFAPYAYDCTLWGPDGELASVNDEGTSLVLSLTEDERDRLRSALGPERVFSAAEWRARHSSRFGRLWQRLQGPRFR